MTIQAPVPGASNSSDEVAKPKKRRSYTPQTLKILFALSGNQCMFPRCTNAIIQPLTMESNAIVLGEIAHIHGASDDGPRPNLSLSIKERNAHPNLILLCPTHHTIVDGQRETYPADVLLQWKKQHEQRVQVRLTPSINDVGFEELEIAARALLNSTPVSLGTPMLVPPLEKIAKNGLSSTCEMLIRMGAAKTSEVEQVIIRAAQLDFQFPDRLKAGFTAKYTELRGEGFTGDPLFLEIYAWAGGAAGNAIRQAAGLCILTHLFIVCDVFER